MIEFVSSPKGKIAATIFDQAKATLGVTAASKWMFSANVWLNGRSPIEAIRQNDIDAVMACAGKLEKKAA